MILFNFIHPFAGIAQILTDVSHLHTNFYNQGFALLFVHCVGASL